MLRLHPQPALYDTIAEGQAIGDSWCVREVNLLRFTVARRRFCPFPWPYIRARRDARADAQSQSLFIHVRRAAHKSKITACRKIRVDSALLNAET